MGVFRTNHLTPSLQGGMVKRAIECVVILVRGQKIGGVDDDLLVLHFFTLIVGYVTPQIAQQSVFRAALDENGDDGGAVGRRIHVDEVKFHVVLLAVNFVFAAMMKMKLLQRQRSSVDSDAAARLVIDLDGDGHC